jgi:hypothetical protein
VPSTTAEKGFPFSFDALLGSMFMLLKEQGAAREIAILLNSDVSATSRYDNWDGGTYFWTLHFGVEVGLYGRLTKEERKEAEGILGNAASQFFNRDAVDRYGGVDIGPKAVDNPQWRNEAATYLSGAGITNQGRVRSDNIASRQVDGLLFRSEPEIHLYRAFKALGVTFAPLPVFLRGGSAYARLEPDFVLIKGGRVMVVEVDGDTYHRESPVDAHERLLPLDREGAKIERVRASQCETPEAARACAEELVQLLDRSSRQA